MKNNPVITSSYDQDWKISQILVFLTFNSCATIFKGSTDGVNFSSDPAGAKVYVNGDLLGTTPFALELKSNKDYTIELKKMDMNQGRFY